MRETISRIENFLNRKQNDSNFNCQYASENLKLKLQHAVATGQSHYNGKKFGEKIPNCKKRLKIKKKRKLIS